MRGETTPPSNVMPETKERAVRVNCQKPSSSRSKMSLSRFEVCVVDKMHRFSASGHFFQWLKGEEEISIDVCVQGVPSRGGTGSQEVSDFVFKELRLAKLPER